MKTATGQSAKNARRYIVTAPASMTPNQVDSEIDLLSESRPFLATNADREAWLKTHDSVGFNSDWWQAPLFLGIIPALLVWLFGRVCRYVLAGN